MIKILLYSFSLSVVHTGCMVTNHHEQGDPDYRPSPSARCNSQKYTYLQKYTPSIFSRTIQHMKLYPMVCRNFNFDTCKFTKVILPAKYIIYAFKSYSKTF